MNLSDIVKWMNTFDLDTGSAAFWDVALKSTLLFTGFWVVVVFLWEQHQRRIVAEREARKPLWELQIDVARRLTEAAARIATKPQEHPEFERGLHEWETLTNGPTAMFMDVNKLVSKQILAFQECYDKLVEANPERKGPLDEEFNSEISELAIGLGAACRRVIAHNWDLSFKQMAGEHWYVKINQRQESTD